MPMTRAASRKQQEGEQQSSLERPQVGGNRNHEQAMESSAQKSNDNSEEGNEMKLEESEDSGGAESDMKLEESEDGADVENNTELQETVRKRWKFVHCVTIRGPDAAAEPIRIRPSETGIMYTSADGHVTKLDKHGCVIFERCKEIMVVSSTPTTPEASSPRSSP